MQKNIIPVVFAVDENYMPYMSVAISSIVKNSNKSDFYRFYVLNIGIGKTLKEKLTDGENYSVEFIDVSKKLDEISGKLPLRDYYTNAIYFRLFIPSLFPEYDKIIYLDSDVVVLKSLSKIYNTDIKDNILGVVADELLTTVDIFGRYSEEYLGIDRRNYFNSGVLLINAKKCREINLEGTFFKVMKKHKFIVAPDQDALNVMCKDKVHYFDLGWNKMPTKNEFNKKEIGLIHFNLSLKPWHYDDITYGEYFWEYAVNSPFYDKILDDYKHFSEEDKKKDIEAEKNLLRLAKSFLNDNFKLKRAKDECRGKN
ncbi:MAG: glycosyltransferase family 8 protein [Clostridiales bacterium]|nr:glycosyltransferase family 8 protein [Clostridiales bacterium]